MANGLRGKFNFRNADLFILPGCDPSTKQSVEHMLDGLAQLASSLPGRVQYVHFPIRVNPPYIAEDLVSWAGRLYYTNQVLPFEASTRDNKLCRDL